MRGKGSLKFVMRGLCLLALILVAIGGDELGASGSDQVYVTRLGEGHIALEGEPFMDGAPVLTHSLALAAGATPALAHIPAGSSYDWHTSTHRQFIFVVQGNVDFTASDGSVHHAAPGSLILFEDTTGKGHRTKCVGPDDHIALAIPLGS